MTLWKDKIVMEHDCSLQHKRSHSKGFMQETDIDEYDIIGTSGERVGTVVVTDHTAVRGFRRTISVEQRDNAGKVVVRESWTE